MSNHTIEQVARRIAEENGRSESTISKIYWFPDKSQIRLVEVDMESIKSEDDSIRPFYFNPVEGVPYPSGIALIHPDEDGRKALPKEWQVDWSQARLVYERLPETG